MSNKIHNGIELLLSMKEMWSDGNEELRLKYVRVADAIWNDVCPLLDALTYAHPDEKNRPHKVCGSFNLRMKANNYYRLPGNSLALKSAMIELLNAFKKTYEHLGQSQDIAEIDRVIFAVDNAIHESYSRHLT